MADPQQDFLIVQRVCRVVPVQSANKPMKTIVWRLTLNVTCIEEYVCIMLLATPVHIH